MEFTVRRATETHLIVRGREQTFVQIRNPAEQVRVVQSASPIPLGGGGYDQSSPTDGIKVVGPTLRIDIDSLPNAD